MKVHGKILVSKEESGQNFETDKFVDQVTRSRIQIDFAPLPSIDPNLYRQEQRCENKGKWVNDHVNT